MADHDEWISRMSSVIQDRRHELGLSQDEFAQRCGFHRTYISDIERGSRNMSLRSLARLADGLEMPAWKLLKLAINGNE